MPDPVVVALIGVCGVALSAAVSWAVSAYQVRASIQKIRLEMQRIYAERLLDARLERYESAYAAIEKTAKGVQRRTTTHLEFQKFCSLIDDWHTSHGFVLSSGTNGRFYTQIRKLKRISESSEAAFRERLADHPKRRELVRDLWVLELALKNDLGVFEVEFFDPSKRFSSYAEVDEAHAIADDKRRKTDA
jgi:hypothetical protein